MPINLHISQLIRALNLMSGSVKKRNLNSLKVKLFLGHLRIADAVIILPHK